MSESAGRAMQHPSNLLPAQVMDSSHAPLVSGWELFTPLRTDPEEWHRQTTAPKHNSAPTTACRGTEPMKPGKQLLPGVHVSMDLLHTQKTST